MPQADKIADLDKSVGEIRQVLDGLHQKINNEKSVSLAWKAVSVIAMLVTGIIGFYVYQYSPKDIFSHVAPVKEKGEVTAQRLADLTDAINKRVDGLEKRLDGLDSRFTEFDRKLDDLRRSLTSGPERTRNTLYRVLPKKEKEAPIAFQNTRDILNTAKQKRVPLEPQDFKKLALPLLHTQYRTVEARQEAWATVKDFVSYKTVVDADKWPVEVPAANVLDGSGGALNLATKDVWEDTVITNCQVNIQWVGHKLVLKNVRFVDCDFKPLAQTEEGRKLLEALLKSNGPTVDVTLVDSKIEEDSGKAS
jgi:hypothetical protein